MVVILALFVFGAVLAGPADDLNGKVMAGYQGWFEAADTGAWRHWSTTGRAPAPGSPTKTGLAFDLWPEMDEYDRVYATDLHMKNGSRAVLFSAQDASTVATHVRWAKEYGIDGFFVQRFVSELTNPALLKHRNLVLQHVRDAAEKEGLTFAVMYDLSGAPEDTLMDTLQKDWAYIRDNVTKSLLYQHHNRRPVLCVWGWGFSDRTQSLDLAHNIVSYLRGAGGNPTLMAGVPFYWRSGQKDSKPGWESLYASVDIISPWAVGRYGDTAGYDALYHAQQLPDMKQIEGKQDYAPVVFPGFSWANLQDVPKDFNSIPRHCGAFFSHQANTLLKSPAPGPLFIYIAMFDEVNEGTAILKAATSQDQTPTDAKFLSLDADPCGPVPSDHYLKLAGTFHK